jgi:hypothetical protein
MLVYLLLNYRFFFLIISRPKRVHRELNPTPQTCNPGLTPVMNPIKYKKGDLTN